ALLAIGAAHGDEPSELVQLRGQFEAIKHPTETDRVHYVTRLVRLRESFTRKDYKKMEAIDAEVVRHPMPSTISTAELRKRISGEWTSPRHNYLYRPDGTWTMLPEVLDGYRATHGVWRIEGNKFFEGLSTESESLELIILLTDTDFVRATGPYYMRRGEVYPWR